MHCRESRLQMDRLWFVQDREDPRRAGTPAGGKVDGAAQKQRSGFLPRHPLCEPLPETPGGPACLMSVAGDFFPFKPESARLHPAQVLRAPRGHGCPGATGHSQASRHVALRSPTCLRHPACALPSSPPRRLSLRRATAPVLEGGLQTTGEHRRDF